MLHAPPVAAARQPSPILQAAQAALHADNRRFFALLTQHGGLPGPFFHTDLAREIGLWLASQRREAAALVDRMVSLDEQEAPGQSGQAFLIIVGTHALAASILQGHEVERSWGRLNDLAADARKVVRDGVAAAVEWVGVQVGGDALLARFTGWTDGFLQAAVALDVLGRRPVLDVLPLSAEEELVARLDEATTLAEKARRADERTQGRRKLLEAISDQIPRMAARFPGVLRWLEQRVRSEQPELRDAFERCVDNLRRQGTPDDQLDPIRKALDGSMSPLRDPTHYKGPTRGRGRKAQRRGERR